MFVIVVGVFGGVWFDRLCYWCIEYCYVLVRCDIF